MGVYTERIERGAARLDIHKPGWRNKIYLLALDLSSMRRCVLGQVLGHFTEHKALGLNWDETSDHGFCLGFEEIAAYDKNVRPREIYAGLTRAWREYIESTREAA